MNKLVALVFALTAAALWAVPALAYTVGPGSTGTTSVSTPSGGTPFTATFTFKDSTGAPIANAAVTFSQTSGPAGCTATFNPTSGTTDANGVISTTVTLPTGCPGGYVLAATATGSGTVTVSVTEAGGLPNASGLPVQVPSWALMLLGAGALIAFAAIVGLARERRITAVTRS